MGLAPHSVRTSCVPVSCATKTTATNKGKVSEKLRKALSQGDPPGRVTSRPARP